MAKCNLTKEIVAMGLPLRLEPPSDLLLSLSLSLSPYIYTQIEDVYHPSRIWSLSFFRADHLSQTHRSPLARCRSFSFGALELFPAQGETGVVQERFGLDSERRREYTGHLESVCQIDCCSC
ncbi:uncharacterized protein LOC114300869 isoform X2 [Camellia sinensis]|nr:uncharacterized protein LOC114300869 isoform X2 [Camellia sinensis]